MMAARMLCGSHWKELSKCSDVNWLRPKNDANNYVYGAFVSSLNVFGWFNQECLCFTVKSR